MPLASMSFNKISRPFPTRYIRRERLFELLDAGTAGPVIWIDGPAGAGKTTLISSYLDTRRIPSLWYHMDERDADAATFFYYLALAARKAAPRRRKALPLLSPEYGQGIPAFARRYFEDFFSRLTPPFVVVFDNYQAAGYEDTLCEVMRNALLEVPPGITVMVASRAEPPPVLTMLKASGRMAQVSWDDLKLTLEESRLVIDLFHREPLDEKAVAALHSKSHEWMTGLILMLTSHGAAHGSPPPRTPQAVFDFFAGDLFATLAPDLRAFLATMAFLPQITPRLAEQLSSNDRAADVLLSLNRRNYFTERLGLDEPTYQFHPLFREFLLSRSREFLSNAEIRDIQQRAALLLAGEGKVEDAAELSIQAGEWDGLTRLIIDAAPSLVEQGRSRTLDGWLRAMPADRVDSDPWLSFWDGICLIADNAPRAQERLATAFHLFRDREDAAGTYLSWATLMETYFYEFTRLEPLDGWIGLLDELRAQFPVYPTPELELKVASGMFVALVLRQTDQEAIFRWHRRMKELLKRNASPSAGLQAEFCLSIYYLWIGDYAKNTYHIAELRRTILSRQAAPALVLSIKVLEAMHAWVTGDSAFCMKVVAEGMEITEQTGMHLWDGLFLACKADAAIVEGDLDLLRELLARMEAALPRGKTLDRLYYHFLSAWLGLLEGDVSQALIQLDGAADWVELMGSLFHEGIWNLGMALTLSRLPRQEEAWSHLETAEGVARRMQSRSLEYMALLTRAHFCFRLGRDNEGLPPLRRAMAIGREYGYCHFVWWQPAMIADLCVRALEAGIETGYVRGLVQKRHLVPDMPPLTVEEWPWPLRIRTMRGFELELNGALLRSSGKVQKKPLEMLKVLIAYGGRDVAEEQIAEALWPEAAGDVAHKSFATTLFRLRQLLNNDEALVLREGRLSLDRHRVWVDVWAFERLAAETREVRHAPDRAPFNVLADKGCGIYRGDFLPSDADKPWSYAMRDRLRSKFILMLDTLCNYWESTGETARAIKGYHDGLEIDPLAEKFYQGLMRCYQKNGQKGEALTTYRRCRQILATMLDTRPSTRTEEIHRAVQEDREA